jgi:hypothetical protein
MKSGHGVPPWHGESRVGNRRRAGFHCRDAGHRRLRAPRRDAVPTLGETPCPHHALCRPPKKWPRRPAVGRGIGVGESRAGNRRRAGFHCRDAGRRRLRAPRRDAVPTLGETPCPHPALCRPPKKWPRRPAVGRGIEGGGIEGGESVTGNRRRAGFHYRDAGRRRLRAPRRDAVPTLGETPCPHLAGRPAHTMPYADHPKSGHGVPPWHGESRVGGSRDSGLGGLVVADVFGNPPE